MRRLLKRRVAVMRAKGKRSAARLPGRTKGREDSKRLLAGPSTDPGDRACVVATEGQRAGARLQSEPAQSSGRFVSADTAATMSEGLAASITRTR
jgi:hypothetical protein